MRKLWLIALLFILISPIYSFAGDDLWDNFGDSNVYGQKPISDEDFDKAIESKTKKKKKDKNIPEGKNFSQSNETEIINNTAKELPILLIPLQLKVNKDYIIPIGHYQVEGFKDENDKVYIKLYQAHDLIAKIPAEETEDDFGENTINFVKLLPHGNYHVELIYGGLDFNAHTIIDIE